MIRGQRDIRLNPRRAGRLRVQKTGDTVLRHFTARAAMAKNAGQVGSPGFGP
jgi:hypothetical protein